MRAYRFELVYTFGEFEPSKAQLEALMQHWTEQRLILGMNGSVQVEAVHVYSGVDETMIQDAVYANKKALMPGPPVDSDTPL